MQVLENLTRVLREVEGGFDNSAHDVEMRRLKISANWEMEIYEFDGIIRKGKVIANIIVLVLY